MSSFIYRYVYDPHFDRAFAGQIGQRAATKGTVAHEDKNLGRSTWSQLLKKDLPPMKLELTPHHRICIFSWFTIVVVPKMDEADNARERHFASNTHFTSFASIHFITHVEINLKLTSPVAVFINASLEMTCLTPGFFCNGRLNLLSRNIQTGKAYSGPARPGWHSGGIIIADNLEWFTVLFCQSSWLKFRTGWLLGSYTPVLPIYPGVGSHTFVYSRFTYHSLTFC